ncbi:hypothetical protein BaRGS_00002925 [Batillaria attramentaria]|uniref:Uncharacterized protein n=1 Tax=Batillaria attramentaria TaxID=370345 RepID=A0ABD0M159_9CAEN
MAEFRPNKAYQISQDPHFADSFIEELRRLHRAKGHRLKSANSHLQFADVEEEFLHAAEFGDVPTVRKLLSDYPDLNVDCIDALGRTALRLAVKNEHLEWQLILVKTEAGGGQVSYIQGFSLTRPENYGAFFPVIMSAGRAGWHARCNVFFQQTGGVEGERGREERGEGC